MTASATKNPRKPSKPHAGLELLALAESFSKHVPIEELEKLPKDGADQHDHYLYGTPKRHD
jgi:hypothetical protein